MLRSKQGFAVRRLSDGKYLSMNAYGGTVWDSDVKCAYPHHTQEEAIEVANELNLAPSDYEVVPGGTIVGDE